MIAYKFKLYNSHKNKHLDKMFEEACYIWNHTLKLQRRYYKIYGKYLNRYTLSKHYTKRYKRKYIGCDTLQEILARIDIAYDRFFNRIAKRPPKMKNVSDFNSFVMRAKPSGNVRGLILSKNTFFVKKLNKTFHFFKHRDIKGKIKYATLTRNKAGQYYIIFLTDHVSEPYRKSHNGASIGVDFGLKNYITISDGTIIDNPEFFKKSLTEIRKVCRKLNYNIDTSNNKQRNIKKLAKISNRIFNQRTDFQWKLAHILCRKADCIFMETLDIESLCQKERYGRKMRDLAHSEFVNKLFQVANKYNVIVHKINKYYPSSRKCTCGYINKDLTLKERKWSCPKCGEVHDRDLLAANNILRQGIVELGVK